MKSLTKSVIVALVLILAAVLPFVVTPALASTGAAAPALQEPEPAPLNLTAFLQWLISSGGSIITVSWLFERMRWFQELTSENKDWTIFGASVVVACSALAVVTYVPAATIAAIAPYFLIVSGSFVVVFMGKAFHRADKAKA